MAKTYDQMHSGLHWARGKASEHACIRCGGAALDWAYQYTKHGEQITDGLGRQYSESFEDYEPMCRSCHRRFDMVHSSNNRDTLLRNLAKGRGAARALGLERLRQSDPDLARKLGAVRSANGKIAGARTNAIRRTCIECGLISNPPGVGRHQKFSGHVGHQDSNR